MHYALKPIPRRADALAMRTPSPAELRRAADARLAADVARRYRLALDLDPEAGVIARCLELPAVGCTAATVTAALAIARLRLADHLAATLSRGDAPPVPLAESESPLAAWSTDLDFADPTTEPDAPADLIPTPDDVLSRMASAEADRYRLLLEQDESHQFTAAIAELPDCFATAPTAEDAAARARTLLADRLLAMFRANQMPPTPLRERETRSAAPLAWVA